MRSSVERHRDTIALLAAVVAPAAVAAALVPVRTTFASPAAALVLVGVVVAVAVVGNRGAGVLASVSASASFDFFLTRPYQRFAISQRADLETAISLLVVGVVVTELAVRNRRHHKDADERMDFVAAVYGLGELVASGAAPSEVIDRARLELIQLLALRDCRYDPRPTVHSTPRIDHNGEVVHRGVIWPEEQIALHRGELEVSVEANGQRFGRFLLVRPSAGPLPVAQRLVGVAVADQVGMALAAHRRTA